MLRFSGFDSVLCSPAFWSCLDVYRSFSALERACSAKRREERARAAVRHAATEPLLLTSPSLPLPRPPPPALSLLAPPAAQGGTADRSS
eukprot:3446589-Rhodomonas_salina.1